VCSDLSALETRLVASRADLPATTAPATTLSTWDVRSARFVDKGSGEQLLGWLFATGSAGELLASPDVVRSAPATCSRVLGSLHVIRLPVLCRNGRLRASGYIDVMPVGAGVTEICVCLRSRSRWTRGRRWRHLEQLADDIARRLSSRSG